MTADFREGQAVKVYPRPGLRVQAFPDIFGRFVPEEGQELPWSEWLAARVRDGSLLLTDPSERFSAHDEKNPLPEPEQKPETPAPVAELAERDAAPAAPTPSAVPSKGPVKSE